MRTVIFDIDGTLADTSHRQHLIRESKETFDQKWHDFHSASVHDPVIPQTRLMLDLLRSAGYRIAFFTGRSEAYKQITLEWLDRHHLGRPGDKLRMRPDGTKNRHDPEIKEEMLKQYISEGHEVFCVFDDRKSVCDMWNRNGVFCFDVAQGQGNFYTAANYLAQTISSIVTGGNHDL